MSPYLRQLTIMLAFVIVTTTSGTVARAASSNAPKAAFFLIGGNAKSTLSDFVQLAGGDKANIAIVTHAAEDPAKVGDDLQDSFNELSLIHI